VRKKARPLRSGAKRKTQNAGGRLITIAFPCKDRCAGSLHLSKRRVKKILDAREFLSVKMGTLKSLSETFHYVIDLPTYELLLTFAHSWPPNRARCNFNAFDCGGSCTTD
jgi:hypothetical protein